MRGYESNIAKNAKSNPKMAYSYVNSKKTIRDSIRALEDDESKRVEDPHRIVTMLSDQFKSVFERDNGVAPEISHIKHLKREYDWGNLINTKEEIILEKLKN